MPFPAVSTSKRPLLAGDVSQLWEFEASKWDFTSRSFQPSKCDYDLWKRN